MNNEELNTVEKTEETKKKETKSYPFVYGISFKKALQTYFFGSEDKTLKVKMSSFPDAICALAVVACFTEGTTILEDAEVCRRKETDRIKVLKTELSKLGADIEETEDSLIIHGHSPLNADGSENKNFILHGGTVESYDDHRMAMSLSCLGLALPKNEELLIKDAECCSVSFPKFYEVMNNIGANFI